MGSSTARTGGVHSPARRAKGVRLPPELSNEGRDRISPGLCSLWAQHRLWSKPEGKEGVELAPTFAQVKAGGAAKDLRANVAVAPRVILCPWAREVPGESSH